mmetsp:Transcript_25308/g.40593  ORF Transcript_25308/g.40593 Transcript_25308/m.40593 type:complete len:208 (+) Transcript_25308:419-1042(+)
MERCREAVLGLEGKSILKPASMKGKSSWKQSNLRGDLTTWINPTNEENLAIRKVVKALENIKLDLNSAIDFKCEKVSVQAAVYPGNGARYVRHKDSYPGGGPQRRITILYYLNPEWQEGDGGELRIHLPLKESDKDKNGNECVPNNKDEVNERTSKSRNGGKVRQSAECFVDIPPTADKVVMFLSEYMEHEVLPSEAKRAAITMWLY